MTRTSTRALAWGSAALLAAGGIAGATATGKGPSPGASPVAQERAGGGAPPGADPDFAQVGRYQVDFAIPEGASAAETFAIVKDRMYVTNAANGTLDIVDISRVQEPVLIERLWLGAPPNSVAATRDLVAVALDASPKTDPGTVRLYARTRDGLDPVRDLTVGSGPDMLLFTDDGRRLLVANEGEPSGYGDEGTDPEGSVSIIDTRGVARGGAPAVRTVGFRAFDEGGPRHDELPEGIRLNGPGASVSQDIEPEYIALSQNGREAYVSLQENNALAVIDVTRARVIRIVSMGLRDHSRPGHGIDASNRDGAINIAQWPVVGIPMPDGIDAFRLKGRDYIITANEGDAREWGSFADVERLGDAADPADIRIPGFDGAEPARDENLGRLNISLTDGFDGPVLRRPHSFGSRSVSILRPDGTLVWDSGNAFERVTAAERPDIFNAGNSNNEFDNRSDDKGPEPEDVAVGTIDGRTYAFVALERVGGLIVLDITRPERGRVVRWVNTRDYSVDPAATDSGPEIVRFVPRAESPTSRPLVVFSNEVSGSIVFLSPAG